MDPNTNQPYQPAPEPQPNQPEPMPYAPPVHAAPPPEHQEDKQPRKLKWTYLLIVLLILVILGLFGFIFMSQNKTAAPAPTPTPQAKVTASPTPESTTSASFTSFEDLSTEAQSLVEANDVIGLVNLQSTTEIECNPDADYIFSICKDATEIETRSGYEIGRVESEGSILSKAEYTKQLQDIFSSNSPFTYVSEKQNGNKAVIVFKGEPTQGTDALLGVQAKSTNGQWNIVGTIYGPLLQPYKDLDSSVFYFN